MTPARAIPVEDLSDLYENAPCGYLSMFLDGRIFRANETLCHWLGLARDGVAGRRFHDILTVPSRIIYETQCAPVLQAGMAFEEVVLDLLTEAGERQTVLISSAWRRDAESGEPFSRLTLMKAGDRRRYERQLLTSREAAEAQAELSHEREAAANRLLEDAREASALREQFVAVLGHDLRNPLASIIGAARLLRKQPQNEKALYFLDLMETSVARMAGLIDNVLDFARGRLGGGLAVDLASKVFLEPALEQVIAEIRSSAPERAIETEFAFPEPVYVDLSRIGQLVSNLLGNAISHGDPTLPVRVGGSVRDGMLELWVANGGEPISPQALERLFQPFFRGDVRARQQGLGLGLYIASEIAAAHRGELMVSSTVDETRFTLRIPVS